MTINLSDPAFITDPYPWYERDRLVGPVVRASNGAYFVNGYSAVLEGLRDPRLLNSPSPFAAINIRNAPTSIAATVANNLIAFLDLPDHTLPRKTLATSLKSMIAEHERAVHDLCTRLTLGWQPGQEVELMAEFAEPFATSCIAAIMGIPDGKMAEVQRWSTVFFYLFLPIPDAATLATLNETLVSFRSFVAGIVEEKRAKPGNDLISLLLQTERNGFRFTTDQLVDNCMLLIADGIENVKTGLVNSIATLLSHPQEMVRLVQSPELLESAVNECLRFESPGQYQGRIAREDMALGRVEIRKHSVVILGLAAANRDPEAFPDPARFDITRQGRRHLAFGFGPHACIGGPLFELEAKVAIKHLLLDRFRLSMPESRLNWVERAGHRWPAQLRLALAGQALKRTGAGRR